MRMEALDSKNFYVPTIPYWWFLIAATIPGKAWSVGSLIWFCYRTVSASKFPVKFSRQYYSLLKVDRKTVWKALIDLEKAGLITVVRGNGRAPLITITLDRKKVPVYRKDFLERKYI